VVQASRLPKTVTGHGDLGMSGRTTKDTMSTKRGMNRGVEEFAPIHQAQLISRLKATGLRLGLPMNFKTAVLKDGIKRIVR
jgi:hypothetical protein